MNQQNLKKLSDVLVASANLGYHTALYGSFNPEDRNEVIRECIDDLITALQNYQVTITGDEILAIGKAIENNFEEFEYIGE